MRRPALGAIVVAVVVVAGCGGHDDDSASRRRTGTTVARTSTSAVARTTAPVVTTTTTLPPTTTAPPTTTTAPPPPPTAPPTTAAAPATIAAARTAATYVFPVTGDVHYGHYHHDYPATDIFGTCGATAVAPVSGTVVGVQANDPWDPGVDDPATRGGRFVTILGVDGVRYYGAHFASVSVAAGARVRAGDPIAVVGNSGNARGIDCHEHFGISPPCPSDDWWVRRGAVYPWPYLDAWRAGNAMSPAAAVASWRAANPNACNAPPA
jgi:murein DD-endopeptidase MepM/ murein hydrolase activator NlpD